MVSGIYKISKGWVEAAFERHGLSMAKMVAKLAVLAALVSGVSCASYVCEEIEHPRSLDMDDITVIKGDGNVHIILEGNYDVLMPGSSKDWQSRSMGWSMAPGYMYIVNYDEPELNDITAFRNGSFGVSHQLAGVNGTATTKSIYGTSERGWTDEDYMYKYVGALFVK